LRDRWFGAYRWLWNTALEIRTEAYRQCGLNLTGNDISRWLTQWKATQGHEWLKVVPATCLTQCLRDQDVAFRACPEEILVQVLAEGDGVRFTRSGQCNRACLEQANLH